MQTNICKDAQVRDHHAFRKLHKKPGEERELARDVHGADLWLVPSRSRTQDLIQIVCVSYLMLGNRLLQNLWPKQESFYFSGFCVLACDFSTDLTWAHPCGCIQLVRQLRAGLIQACWASGSVKSFIRKEARLSYFTQNLRTAFQEGNPQCTSAYQASPCIIC